MPNLNLGTGTTLNFNAATATSSNRNMPFSGNGTVNFNSSGSLTIGTGQLQQTAGTTLHLFVNPVSVGQIRSFSNSGGGIRLHASLNKALGLGVTGSAAHDGRIFLVENGVVSSGALSTGGGLVNNATMDVTFGTDIAGTGTATHSGTFVFNNLNAGLAGTNATIRLDVGTDDTLNMTGVISGTAGGYTTPVFRKQGLGTAVLTGANSYSIPTRVAAGTLIVTPAQTGNSAVTVDDGATFGVTLTAPGTTYNTSTLTVGNGAGASLRFNAGTLGTPTAALTNANFLNVNAPTTVDFIGTNLTAGTFTLIDYTGSIGGLGFAGFSTLNLPTARPLGRPCAAWARAFSRRA